MRVSVVLPDCGYLSKSTEATRHGAFLASAAFLKWVANEPAFDKLEVFLPPAVLGDQDALRNAAETTLLPENRGRGRLSFYAVHHAPEVWADGVPRILRSLDPHFMARDRYLRDSFAQGTMALSVDTHVMAAYEAWSGLKPVLQAPPAGYDSIQCISGSLSDAIRSVLKDLGCEDPPFRLDVISRPVDCGRFRPPTPDEKAESRRSLQIPPDATVAMFHSRVGAHSKADLYPLVQAFARASGPNDWLVVGGAPSSETAYDTLEGWLVEAGVGGRSVLLGSCPPEDVPTRLWAADFFVLPCDNPSEGLGVAPIEAMATGLPALVSDWDGMKEAVHDGRNGFRVPTYWVPGSDRLAAFSPFMSHLAECLLLAQCVVVDQEILAERIGVLYQDSALRQRMGASARIDALAYSQKAIGERLLKTFTEQLDEAAAEGTAAKEARRAYASALALPTPYQAILSGQGTRVLGTDDRLEITQKGRDLLEGKKTIPTYQEVGLLAGPKTMGQVLELFAQGPQTLGTIAHGNGENGFEDSNYAVATLLKRGVVRLSKVVG